MSRSQIILPALIFACSSLLSADSRFQVRRMTRNDVPAGKGQCDIRLQIDSDAEVSLRGETVEIRTINGREGRDDGSECNAPFQGRDAIRSFRYEQREARNSMRVVEEPSPRNGNRVLVAIHDPDGGEGRYIFRISWDLDQGGNFSGGGRPPYQGGGGRPDFGGDGGRPGYDRPNDPGFGGGGNSGQWSLNSREFNATSGGNGRFYVANTPDRELSDVSIQLNRGGDAYIEFRGRGNASFRGRWSKRGADHVTVTIRQFVQTDADGRVEIDFRNGRLYRIVADGTTGQRGNRFQLNFTAR